MKQKLQDNKHMTRNEKTINKDYKTSSKCNATFKIIFPSTMIISTHEWKWKRR